MSALTAVASDQESLGYFRIWARPPGGRRREVTIVRNSPIQVTGASTSDPFTDQTATLSLPQVTLFDNPGTGDLDWLVPDCDIDIVWENTGYYDLEWRWEGHIVSFSMSQSGSSMSFNVDLRGALYALDNYLAIPSFPKRPIPYEILIAKAFDQGEHPARLGTFRMNFPEWWDLRVPGFNSPEYLSFLKPWGVATGQLWTGFTSRSTGSWEPLLTGHVQSLLTVMFAEGGSQWSVRNIGNRRPELYLRTIPEADDGDIIEIDLGSPGVSIDITKDYSQRATVIYGQGVDEAGISYSGMEVSPDGKTTTYKPFAYSPLVYPRKKNPRFRPTVMPKETMIRFQDGVDQASAIKIAQGQLHRFSEPGITGTITLQTDARFADGGLCPRMLIKAGATVRILGLFGQRDGVLVHITQTNANFDEMSISMTYDSKHRDQLTVEEVKARTRDALTPMRALQVGKYSNTVQDLILPWSYKEGSGCVPLESKEFFLEKLPSTAEFPFEEYTTQYPPSNPSYRPYYIRINPTNVNNSSKNWSGVARDGQQIMSIPIRMGQAGEIKLTQIAAYDKDGHVLPVRFHVSVYYNNGVAADAMPNFPDDPATLKWLQPQGITTSYQVGQANPFFKDAWEQSNADGTVYQNASYLPAKDAGLIVGWGNYYEPAGYSPGRFSRGAERTGVLEDTASWAWDLTQPGNLDVLSPENNANEEYAGMLFIQIFCDEQGTEPVYFLGRFFKTEAGTSS